MGLSKIWGTVQGHEDLRQDERVMQLFGLVNTMLAHDRTTAERDLSIARYAVIPLSPNSGKFLLAFIPPLHGLLFYQNAAMLLHNAMAFSQRCDDRVCECLLLRIDRVGAQHGHAACIDPRVPRCAQDPPQCRAPPDAGHGA